MESEIKIAVIGLGYVGLPLARLFSTKYKTVGFDMNKSRVNALMAGHDATLEVSDELLQSAIANGFKCTADIEDIRDCNFYVVAVPTPVDHNHNPDLTPLYNASTTVGKVISKGDIAVSSNQPRLEGKKIPFGTCSLQYILSINPHTHEYLGKLIDKGYIDITLRILNDFGRLCHLHRGSQMCSGRYNRSIHFVHFLTNFKS